ncbi:hypothetical protein AGLY_010314 [Aphis glycines]|uniref:Uncharacterized protein n=1 Tax=Aphis glycines TaxID=307491 RepID=A0A6G0TFT9_APHGL|nr:hypothetical protein AGLY_010314 [Aphis glycines]
MDYKLKFSFLRNPKYFMKITFLVIHKQFSLLFDYIDFNYCTFQIYIEMYCFIKKVINIHYCYCTIYFLFTRSEILLQFNNILLYFLKLINVPLSLIRKLVMLNAFRLIESLACNIVHVRSQLLKNQQRLIAVVKAFIIDVLYTNLLINKIIYTTNMQAHNRLSTVAMCTLTHI